jgi:hypothetical protein
MLTCRTGGEIVIYLSIRDQHYALIIFSLFITHAPTCFGTYVPSSGSVLFPCELLESPKWLCNRYVPLYCKCWWPLCTGCCSPAERICAQMDKVTLAGYCYAMRHGINFEIVTPYRVSHWQSYGVTVRGNVTGVYPP